jgi:hypothetical protein
MTVQGNTVSSNDATNGGGGGLDLFVAAQDLPAGGTALTMTASDNQITGNTADDSNSTFPLGGGGILSTLISWRTDTPGLVFDVSGNDIRSNFSEYGGGVKLLASADADPDLDGVVTARTTATIGFHHNLLAINDAFEPTFFTGVGGGGVAALQAFGDADAAIDLSFNTVASNSTDFGSAGFEIAATTDTDTNGNFDGNTTLEIANSIVSNNLSGYGIGGLPASGTGNLTVDVVFNDVFGNSLGNYDPLLFAVDPTGTFGNISEDPLLSPNFVPGICSPTIDAADPAEPFSDEPDPDGQRANMGDLGGTPSATVSLPDPSGDSLVDGIDILRIATSFASVLGDGWYSSDADVDKNGEVDGNDLSFVAAYYGTSCP